MPSMTLFDVSDLPRSEPAPPPDEARTTEVDPLSPPAPADTFPEVEVRVSKRRKKTSEAKWVGGRIVVSVPAHLDRASRQKTVDWLVERLLATSPAAVMPR